MEKLKQIECDKSIRVSDDLTIIRSLLESPSNIFDLRYVLKNPKACIKMGPIRLYVVLTRDN